MVKDHSCASLRLTNIHSKPVFWIKKPTLNWNPYNLLLLLLDNKTKGFEAPIEKNDNFYQFWSFKTFFCVRT